MLFISQLKLFSFLLFLNLCLVFFGYVDKRLDKKAKVNFKFYGVINWEQNNYNVHITQYTKR